MEQYFRTYNSGDMDGVRALFDVEHARFAYYDNIAGDVTDIKPDGTDLHSAGTPALAAWEQYLRNRSALGDHFTLITVIVSRADDASQEPYAYVTATRTWRDQRHTASVKVTCDRGRLTRAVIATDWR